MHTSPQTIMTELLIMTEHLILILYPKTPNFQSHKKKQARAQDVCTTQMSSLLLTLPAITRGTRPLQASPERFSRAKNPRKSLKVEGWYIFLVTRKQQDKTKQPQVAPGEA